MRSHLLVLHLILKKTVELSHILAIVLEQSLYIDISDTFRDLHKYKAYDARFVPDSDLKSILA